MTFLNDIAAHAATLDKAKTVEINKRVKSRLDRHVRVVQGSGLGKLTPFQYAFLDLMYPDHYQPLWAEAQKRIQSYYGEERMPFPKLHRLEFPTPEKAEWEMSLSEGWDGPVIVCSMKGWKRKDLYLVD
jgi:hypothetical protein